MTRAMTRTGYGGDAYVPTPAEAPMSGVARLVRFNEEMERTAALPLNERGLERLLAKLPALSRDYPRIYWLTGARIMELSLICAGDYADAGEFAAAGDLLVNPRVVDIDIDENVVSVRKDRHRSMIAQFAPWVDDADPVRWLSEHTRPRIIRQPLLPELRRWLGATSIFAPAYLHGIDQRMRRIADTIGFLAAGSVSDPFVDFNRPGAIDPPAEAFVNAHLCRFDRAAFDAMGEGVRWLSGVRPASRSGRGEPVEGWNRNRCPSVLSILV